MCTAAGSEQPKAKLAMPTRLQPRQARWECSELSVIRACWSSSLEIDPYQALTSRADTRGNPGDRAWDPRIEPHRPRLSANSPGITVALAEPRARRTYLVDRVAEDVVGCDECRSAKPDVCTACLLGCSIVGHALQSGHVDRTSDF